MKILLNQAKINEKIEKEIMEKFCMEIKEKISEDKIDESFSLVYEKMAEYPHRPEPHNLLAILLEIDGDHLLAMKHLRAARALDPSYEPTNKNLSSFGSESMRRPLSF